MAWAIALGHMVNIFYSISTTSTMPALDKNITINVCLVGVRIIQAKFHFWYDYIIQKFITPLFKGVVRQRC